MRKKRKGCEIVGKIVLGITKKQNKTKTEQSGIRHLQLSISIIGGFESLALKIIMIQKYVSKYVLKVIAKVNNL